MLRLDKDGEPSGARFIAARAPEKPVEQGL
jgi:hypothetical protein